MVEAIQLGEERRGVFEGDGGVCMSSGLVSVIVPTKNSVDLFNWLGLTWKSRNDISHIRYYTKKDIKDLFIFVKRLGFKEIYINPWSPTKNGLIGFLFNLFEMLDMAPGYLVEFKRIYNYED
jgi:hypothetical protein